ncbi:MAG TPA: FHA domain-containing protein [Kofleriaceae bacterium]
MLRLEVTELGQGALPAVDLGGRIIIGSGIDAQLRLPATACRGEHVVLEKGTWKAFVDLTVDDATVRAGSTGPIGDGVTLSFGAYRVRVVPAPPGTVPSPPQRTESLARELVRGLLGVDAAPVVTIERGPGAGAKRTMPPPESVVVIGRGDEATWPIADADLSRAHVELRRGWDGTTVADLGSKNGTRVDGVKIATATLLYDGALVEIGNVALRYRDPAERHLRLPASASGSMHPAPAGASTDIAPSVRRRSSTMVIALVVAVLALAALAWVLAS